MNLWNLAQKTYPSSLRGRKGMTYRAVRSSRRRKVKACISSTTWPPTSGSIALENEPTLLQPSCQAEAERPEQWLQFESVRTLIRASCRPRRFVASRLRSQTDQGERLSKQRISHQRGVHCHAWLLVRSRRPAERDVGWRPLSWNCWMLRPARLFRRFTRPGGSGPYGCGCCCSSFPFNNKHERRSKD